MDPRAQEQVETEVAAASYMRRQKETWLDEFFDRKDRELWEAYKATPINDTVALACIHHATKSMGSLKQEVQTIMDSGKLAQAAIDIDTNQ